MFRSASPRCLMLIALVLASHVGSASASQMYWTNSSLDRIQHAELDGSGVGIVTGGVTSLGLAIDLAAGKLYSTVAGPPVPGSTGTIRRSNLDGTGSEILVDGAHGVGGPLEIKLDVAAGKLYWTDAGLPGPRIMRANLDGSAVETLFFASDHRAPNYGSGPGQTLEFSSVWGLALDLAAGDMYWTDFFGDDIHRAKLDGSGISGPLVSGLAAPRGLALDIPAGQMYWTEQQDSTIFRAALDGSGVQLIADDLVGVDEAFGIAIDPVPGKLYWTNIGSGQIQRADLDGQNVESLVALPGQDLIAIALIPTVPTVPALSIMAQCLLVGLTMKTAARSLAQRQLA